MGQLVFNQHASHSGHLPFPAGECPCGCRRYQLQSFAFQPTCRASGSSFHSRHSPGQDRSRKVHHIRARRQPLVWPQHQRTSSSCPTVRIHSHHRLGVRNHRVLHIHTRRQPQSQQTSCRSCIQHSRIRHRLGDRSRKDHRIHTRHRHQHQQTSCRSQGHNLHSPDQVRSHKGHHSRTMAWPL